MFSAVSPCQVLSCPLGMLHAGAPLITTVEQRHALVKSCLDVSEPGPFMARLRTLGMYFVSKATAARPDEIRAKMVSGASPT